MKRRTILKALSAITASTPVLGRALAALADGETRITPVMIRRAEWITGLEFSEEERELMLQDMNDALVQWEELRDVEIGNSLPPALQFDPAPSHPPVTGGRVAWRPFRGAAPPGGPDDVAFASVSELATWLRVGEISSTELTELYLERLRKHDPQLSCVISRTEERAMEHAAESDRRRHEGTLCGPLDGIPWGAKDLLAVPGYRTTWGAKPFEKQMLRETATVVRKLDDAGAVLVAKLSVGALAWGDVWFGGTTKNPWNVEQGSSGSSAGPAAATAGGLVGFAIGTETWGSIVSPSTRCGVTGLRPTFGRVSRNGCMALSWSMDKIGPMARSAADCAWIFDAIRGEDGLDPTARDAAFSWPPEKRVDGIRVGYTPDLFEEDRSAGDGTEEVPEEVRARAREWEEIDRRTLGEIEALGVKLIPIELPKEPPLEGLALILTAEATAAFDELTRSGRDDLLVRQERHAWPNVFRQGQLIPAVEYLRANRIRTLLMREMEKIFERVDVYVTPTFGGDNLLLTNLTGHPQLVAPNGFRASDGTPASITFTGRLFGEEELLAVGEAYQAATGYHRRRPSLPDPEE